MAARPKGEGKKERKDMDRYCSSTIAAEEMGLGNWNSEICKMLSYRAFDQILKEWKEQTQSSRDRMDWINHRGHAATGAPKIWFGRDEKRMLESKQASDDDGISQHRNLLHGQGQQPKTRIFASSLKSIPSLGPLDRQCTLYCGRLNSNDPSWDRTPLKDGTGHDQGDLSFHIYYIRAGLSLSLSLSQKDRNLGLAATQRNISITPKKRRSLAAPL